MKTIKKILCLCLTLLLAVTMFAGCHKANEVALTIGSGKDKVEITSAYYLCTLVNAYQEGQQKVNEAKAEEKKEETEEAEEIDYLKEKIDGKSFTEWVENRAMEILLNYAALKNEMKANKVELGEEELQQVDSMASTYWIQYGYQSIFEKNGVSYETYKSYMKASNEDYTYFNSIYGHDGKKAVDHKELNQFIKAHYVPVDQAYYPLTNSDGSAVDDATKQEYLKTLNSYAKKLNAGKTTFAKVYKAVNGELQEGQSYSTYVGDDKTEYALDEFDKVKKLKDNKAIVLELDGAIVLLYKRPITKAVQEELHDGATYNMKHDEFTKELDEIGKTLKVSKNDFAFNRLKVKNIDVTVEAAE